jgi:hypothetical protein
MTPAFVYQNRLGLSKPSCLQGNLSFLFRPAGRFAPCVRLTRLLDIAGHWCHIFAYKDKGVAK